MKSIKDMEELRKRVERENFWIIITAAIAAIIAVAFVVLDIAIHFTIKFW